MVKKQSKSSDSKNRGLTYKEARDLHRVTMGELSAKIDLVLDLLEGGAHSRTGIVNVESDQPVPGSLAELAQQTAEEAGLVEPGTYTGGPRGADDIPEEEVVPELLTALSRLELDRFTELYGAITHPTRIRIVSLVAAGPRRVKEISALLNIQNLGTAYNHVRVLLESGWIIKENNGDYSLNPERHLLLLKMIRAAR